MPDVWDELRKRIAIPLPPLDPSIEAESHFTINGLEVGDRLGGGAFGNVYKLMRDGIASGQVVKTIPKHSLVAPQDVDALGREIKAMTCLSSQVNEHPHVIQLLGIHLSESCIFLRLEDGGPRNLYKRLQHRDFRRSPLTLLSCCKVKSIFSQISSAVCYLHEVPAIAHLDIKPENFILDETAENIHISLSDFDTAIVHPPALLRGSIGTLPFIAPEMVHQDSFDPFAADVWSMAVVCLEVVCHLYVLERALRLDRLPSGASRDMVKAHQKNSLALIRDYFVQEDATSKLLDRRLRLDLQDMKGALESTLPGMLEVTNSWRSTSSQVLLGFSFEDPIAVKIEEQ